MSYKDISEVPAQVKTHKDIALTLIQANYWAAIYDGVKDDPKIEVPAAVAWKQFELKYQISGDAWSERTVKTEKGTVAVNFAIMKQIAEEEQIVYGIAMRPDDIDTDNEFVRPETVVKSAIKFMKNYGGFNLDHAKDDKSQINSGIVESTIVRAPFKLGEEEVKKGDWFIGVYIPLKEDWEEVKKRGGLSIEGTGKRKTEKADVGKVTLTLTFKGE